MSDLLYTQEDIDEWLRTCAELQDTIYKQKVEIAQLMEERENMQDEIFALEMARLQAAKNTAEEICVEIVKDMPQPIKDKWLEWFKEHYDVEVE